MSDWLKTHSDNAGKIFRIATELHNLASALRRVGNKDLADDILYYAEQLDISSEAMRKAVAQSVNEAFKQTQEMSASILNATLAGIKMGEDKEDRFSK